MPSSHTYFILIKIPFSYDAYYECSQKWHKTWKSSLCWQFFIDTANIIYTSAGHGEGFVGPEGVKLIFPHLGLPSPSSRFPFFNLSSSRLDETIRIYSQCRKTWMVVHCACSVLRYRLCLLMLLYVIFCGLNLSRAECETLVNDTNEQQKWFFMFYIATVYNFRNVQWFIC